MEQSAWYKTDPIAIAVSDLEKVNRMLPVWNSIRAIVECSPKELEEKREKWTRHIKAHAEFTRNKIPNEIYGRIAERAEYWKLERDM